MKFGGTSVQDATAIHNAANIIQREQVRVPLIVVSACAGVTDMLIQLGELSSHGEEHKALGILEELYQRHQQIVSELAHGSTGSASGRTRSVKIANKWEGVRDTFMRDSEELRRLILSLSVLKELTPRTLDQIMSYGERWSSLLLYHELCQLRIPTIQVDARTILITNADFNHASPQMQLTETKTRELILPFVKKQQVVVTQGFIGSTSDSATTTLGRGGSDYSAAILGTVLDAEEIQIWTDVDGILSADPSILPGAYRIKRMTFEEASELAYFGAKVLHPSTILPAIEKDIPVRVLNSRNPESEGTLITREQTASTACIIKSIAYKEGITVVNVKSTRMLMAHGFLSKVFEVFAIHKKSVDVIATSEVGVALTVDSAENLEPLVHDLQSFAEVTVHHGKAVLCVVGENMRQTKGIAARLFAALDRSNVNVELISHGGSEINLTFVIKETDIEQAVKALHDEFFSGINEKDPMFDINHL